MPVIVRLHDRRHCASIAGMIRHYAEPEGGEEVGGGHRGHCPGAGVSRSIGLRPCDGCLVHGSVVIAAERGFEAGGGLAVAAYQLRAVAFPRALAAGGTVAWSAAASIGQEHATCLPPALPPPRPGASAMASNGPRRHRTERAAELFDVTAGTSFVVAVCGPQPVTRGGAWTHRLPAHAAGGARIREVRGRYSGQDALDASWGAGWRSR